MNKSLSNVLTSDVSDRTWITRISVLAAVLATIAGTTLAFGQDKNDGFDRPLNGDQAQAAPEPQGQSSSTTYMSINDNGKQYSMEARDGKITRVEIDGKRVSKDRWRYDGKKLEFLDKDGNVEKTMDLQMDGKVPQVPGVPGVQLMPRVRVFQGDRDALRNDANKAFEELRRAEGMQLRGQQGAQENLRRALAVMGEDQPKVMLGVTFSEVGEDEDGIVIDSVIEGLPADNAGIKEGDVILKVGDKEVLGNGTFRMMLRDFKPDEKVDMTILRDGQRRTVTVVLEAYDAEKLGTANMFAFPGGDGMIFAPGEALGEGGQLNNLFGLRNSFGGIDHEKMREEFDRAREQLQVAMEQLKAINKDDFEKAREDATKELSKVMESLDSLKEKLTAENRSGVWTTTPRGDVLVTPQPSDAAPRAPRTPRAVRSRSDGTAPAATSDDMKKLLEKLEQLETKVEELQKKKE